MAEQVKGFAPPVGQEAMFPGVFVMDKGAKARSDRLEAEVI